MERWRWGWEAQRRTRLSQRLPRPRSLGSLADDPRAGRRRRVVCVATEPGMNILGEWRSCLRRAWRRRCACGSACEGLWSRIVWSASGERRRGYPPRRVREKRCREMCKVEGASLRENIRMTLSQRLLFGPRGPPPAPTRASTAFYVAPSLLVHARYAALTHTDRTGENIHFAMCNLVGGSNTVRIDSEDEDIKMRRQSQSNTSGGRRKCSRMSSRQTRNGMTSCLMPTLSQQAWTPPPPHRTNHLPFPVRPCLTY